jgi:hypothetical protein
MTICTSLNIIFKKIVNNKTNSQTCYKLYINEDNVQNYTFTIEFCQIVIIMFEILRKYVIHIKALSS